MINHHFVSGGVRTGDGKLFRILRVQLGLRFAEAGSGVGLFVEKLAITFYQLCFGLIAGMPYDMPMGNFDNRATASLSCLLTAVLNDCQKASIELCAKLATTEQSRTSKTTIIFFIVLQSDS